MCIFTLRVKNNKIMKQTIYRHPTQLDTSKTLRDGQSLEEFLRKAMMGNEPIEATAKVTYNARKDGVLPQHDIRTDRWEIAQEATTKIHKSKAAERQKADFGEVVEQAKNGNIPVGEA